jgi:hypothetical protein
MIGGTSAAQPTSSEPPGQASSGNDLSVAGRAMGEGPQHPRIEPLQASWLFAQKLIPLDASTSCG